MIPEEIKHNHFLKPYKNDWLMGIIELPNRIFHHYFKAKNGFVYNTTIQNYDNRTTIDNFLKTIDKEIDKQELDLTRLNKIPLSDIEEFTHLVFAPFKYTIIPNSNFPDFDKKRIYIYPIHSFELAGKESIKDMKAITKRGLSTTDWNRKSAPLIYYKFSNPKHQYGTTGKSLIIGNESNVYSALNNFETNDCLMEIQNSIGEKISITFNESTKNYKINDDEILDIEDLEEYLHQFYIEVIK